MGGEEGGGGVGDALVAPSCLPPFSLSPSPLTSFSPSPLTSFPPSYTNPYLLTNDSDYSSLSPNTSAPTVLCQGGAACTISGPGATIISPLLLSLTGVTGHIWALCYLHTTSPRAGSRSVFHTLLLTLMWTDFLGKLVTTPPAIAAYAMGEWYGGKGMCDYHGFTMVLVCLVTHFTVSAMSVERFLGICHGYFYARHITTARCRYLLLVIWVLSSLFSLLPLFDVGQIFLQYPKTWCFANLHLCPTTPARHRFFTTALGVISVANMATIIVCNVFVVGALLRMRLSRKLPAGLGQGIRGQTDHELQMVVLLVVLTIVFTISWAPLDTILVINPTWPPHLEDADHMKELVAIRMVSLNQIFDPWAYIICRVVFRSRVWRLCRVGMVGRRFSRRLEDASTWSQHLTSLLKPRKLSRQHTQQHIQHTPPPEIEIDPPAAPQGPLVTLPPGVQRASYSDSGRGSCTAMETVEGGTNNNNNTKKPPPSHPCCLHHTNNNNNTTHMALHHTRSQPLCPLLPPHSTPESPHQGDCGITRSNSWGYPVSCPSTENHPTHLHTHPTLCPHPSPTPSHSRSTQTLPCPPSPPLRPHKFTPNSPLHHRTTQPKWSPRAPIATPTKAHNSPPRSPSIPPYNALPRQSSQPPTETPFHPQKVPPSPTLLSPSSQVPTETPSYPQEVPPCSALLSPSSQPPTEPPTHPQEAPLLTPTHREAQLPPQPTSPPISSSPPSPSLPPGLLSSPHTPKTPTETRVHFE